MRQQKTKYMEYNQVLIASDLIRISPKSRRGQWRENRPPLSEFSIWHPPMALTLSERIVSVSTITVVLLVGRGCVVRASETDILVPARAGGETNSRGKRRRLPHQYSTFQSIFLTDFPKFHPLGHLPKRSQRRGNQLIAWKSIISFCQKLPSLCPPTDL